MELRRQVRSQMEFGNEGKGMGSWGGRRQRSSADKCVPKWSLGTREIIERLTPPVARSATGTGEQLTTASRRRLRRRRRRSGSGRSPSLREKLYMPITRTTLLGGPAAAMFGGHTYFARDGILVTPALELEAVDSDAQGVVDASATLAPVAIRFTPSAPFADLVALYPWLEGAPGISLFGATDSPLVLVAANGVRLTFAAAAVVQMPDLLLGAKEPVTGAVTFLAIGARSLPIMAANRLVAIDSAEFPARPTGTAQLADDFAVTWGGAPWLTLRARDGVKVELAMKSRPVISAANALVDMTLDSLVVTVRFVPASPAGGSVAEADVVQGLQAEGSLPGRLLSLGARTLEVVGQHVWLRLPLAQLTAGPLEFDAVSGRLGELVFTATRAVMGAEDQLEALAGLSEGEPD